MLVRCLLLSLLLVHHLAQAATYYVSSASGNDSNDGQSLEQAFQSISRVQQLSLQPGDAVRFLCGEEWRATPLVLTHSGTAENPIVIGSFPESCDQRPVLSGTQPISEWVSLGNNLYQADLDEGQNAGLFPQGINQVFSGDQRLPIARWPDPGQMENGYSRVDAHQAGSNQLSDNQLPAADWTGAALHIKGMRWYILNRTVTASNGKTLTLSSAPECWTGNCEQWGFWLSDHPAALSRNGEWTYDPEQNRVTLLSTTGLPENGELEGSVLIEAASNQVGAIILGTHLFQEIEHIHIENLEIRGWADAGITTPVNLESAANRNLQIRNCWIHDVDSTGIRLAHWIWNAGENSGWRGGSGILIEDNLIERANHFGIDGYPVGSTIRGNTIRNIGIFENLNRSGLGCGFDSGGGFCTESGAGIRIKLDRDFIQFGGADNWIVQNRLERIGMQGMDIFGPRNTIEQNVIQEACWTKGDCGAIRTFGRDGFSNSQVFELDIRENIILDTLGNTDGTHPTYSALFGFGLYIDHWSDDIEVVGNTVKGSTAAGILFQNSRGSIRDNVLYDNARGTLTTGQLALVLSPTSIDMGGNIAYGLDSEQFTLRVQSIANLTASSGNWFLHPYRSQHIWVEDGNSRLDLAGWTNTSGMDQNSQEIWFSLNPEDLPRSQLFFNDSNVPVQVSLGQTAFLDLEQNPVTGSLLLQPWESRILIRNGSLLPSKVSTLHSLWSWLLGSLLLSWLFWRLHSGPESPEPQALLNPER